MPVRPACVPWTETVLYRFTNGADGAVPEYGDLIFDNAGSIYGTTSGSNVSFGSVFKLTKSGGTWTETTLYTFQGGSDGEFPNGGVIFDHAGNLYGTTNTNAFELSPSNGGWTQTVIQTFNGMNEGFSSEAGVVFDSAGNLYGSVDIEGPEGDGSIFQLTPSGGSWSLGIIHDGGALVGTNLSFDSAGNLYGARISSRSDDGEAFKMSLVDGSWTYTLLHAFTGGDQGDTPYDGMVMDANGNLWGTSSEGGTHNYGIVYEITP
ncbi:MAG: choice-of-anchor tandem repeat GloVer-containing protein [Candidatus Korobacteraceae bacterium]